MRRYCVVSGEGKVSYIDAVNIFEVETHSHETAIRLAMSLHRPLSIYHSGTWDFRQTRFEERLPVTIAGLQFVKKLA